MTLDLSYLVEQPSDAQEAAVRLAVERECLLSIAAYLQQIHQQMTDNNIETINQETVLAMADEMEKRAANHGQTENE